MHYVLSDRSCLKDRVHMEEITVVVTLLYTAFTLLKGSTESRLTTEGPASFLYKYREMLYGFSEE